jgi:hypothetical protein
MSYITWRKKGVKQKMAKGWRWLRKRKEGKKNEERGFSPRPKSGKMISFPFLERSP